MMKGVAIHEGCIIEIQQLIGNLKAEAAIETRAKNITRSYASSIKALALGDKYQNKKIEDYFKSLKIQLSNKS